MARFRGDWARVVGEKIDGLFVDLTALHASRVRMTASVLLHYLDWLIGIGEVLVVLSFMGHPVSLADAVLIESLMHAVRGAAFAVPGALGAQEGGLIVLCAIFGVPPEPALALSLVKRLPDLVLGVPGPRRLAGDRGLHWHGDATRSATGTPDG